jgi:hypothetical protein
VVFIAQRWPSLVQDHSLIAGLADGYRYRDSAVTVSETKAASLQEEEILQPSDTSCETDLKSPASGDQLDDKHYYRDHQEDVNQTAGDVETEAQKPQDQQDYENRPKHARSPFCMAGS